MKRRYKAKITWETNPNDFLFELLSFEDLVELDCQRFPAIHHPELNNEVYVWSGIGIKKYRKKLIKEMKQSNSQRI